MFDRLETNRKTFFKIIQKLYDLEDLEVLVKTIFCETENTWLNYPLSFVSKAIR